MAFHDVDYDAYCILGDPDAPALWNWPVWERFRVEFDPLIKAARGSPGVRSTQYLPNRGGTVKFGRIGWKEADHQKWTHGSPTNQDESKSWGFLGGRSGDRCGPHANARDGLRTSSCLSRTSPRPVAARGFRSTLS